MQINLIQAFLIGLVYYLGINGTPWLTMLGSTSLMRPMVCGTLVGLILGDPVAGCTIGAAINLPYIAWNAAGRSAVCGSGTGRHHRNNICACIRNSARRRR